MQKGTLGHNLWIFTFWYFLQVLTSGNTNMKREVKNRLWFFFI